MQQCISNPNSNPIILIININIPNPNPTLTLTLILPTTQPSSKTVKNVWFQEQHIQGLTLQEECLEFFIYSTSTASAPGHQFPVADQCMSITDTLSEVHSKCNDRVEQFILPSVGQTVSSHTSVVQTVSSHTSGGNISWPQRVERAGHGTDEQKAGDPSRQKLVVQAEKVHLESLRAAHHDA